MRPWGIARLPGLPAAVLLVLGVAVDLGAQTVGMRFERLSVEDGLSQGTVNHILQDRNGFLWLATQDGLNRYDGYRFEVYEHDPEDPASLPGNWVQVLAQDAAGDLWIGTDGAGLARWRRATDSFVRFRHDAEDPASLSGDRVVSIRIDHRGDVWIGTVESGLNRLDPDSGLCERFRHDPATLAGLSGDYVQTLYEDAGGNLWIGTFSGLDRYDVATREFAHYRHDPEDPKSLSDERVLSILEDHSGGLWVGTMDGLNRMAADGAGFTRFVNDPADPVSLSQNRIRALFEDGAGRLWAGTDDGLNLLQRPAAGPVSFAHYRHETADPSSLSNDRVTSIFQDRGGVLWIGTQVGVNKWNPATWAFSHFKADPAGADSLSSNDVFGFSVDLGGNVWIATHGGVNRLDRAGGGFVHYRHDPGDRASLSDDRVAALLHDRQGTLWVATLAAGLNRRDAGEGGFRHYRHDPERPGSLSHDAVASLFEDRRGDLWVGTWAGGLNRFDRGTDSFVRYRHDPQDPASLSADRVTAFADHDGGLWIGTFGGGLNRLDETAAPSADRDRFLRLRHSERPDSLSNDTVFALHVDSGALWAGTQGGLNRLEGLAGGEASFRRYLPRDVVWGIEPEAEGRLWLSTNDGLARFDPGSEALKRYTPSHGLQSLEFNFGAHYKSRDGELFFGGVNGFNAFYPDRIPTNAAAPPVVLTGFAKFNRPVSFAGPVFDVDELVLSHRDRFLAFEFAALDYTAPRENHYRYRLDGLDDHWVDLGNQRRVTFPSIAPGRYTLEVEGSNNDGVWSSAGLALRIEVAPPYWQTWWFRASGSVVAVALVVLGFRIRTRQIRKLNERLQALVKLRTHELEEAHAELVKKERLATVGELAGGIAHEIRTPLSVMQNTLYLLGRKLQTDGTEKYFKRLEQQIQRTDRIVRELLDYTRGSSADYQPVSLPEIVGKVLAEAEVPGTVRVERRCDPAPLIAFADGYQVHRILANLINNAIQAMPEGGELRLECSRVGDEVAVSVIDAGVGIPEQELSRVFEPLFTTKADGIGLGLAVSQRYARLNRGRIECDSLAGQGAVFRLMLPVAADGPPASATDEGRAPEVRR